jgi:pyruvate/2-oxoglutarate dehydrogenase complex dihydrolipoamide acyltransferase (E2) component
MTDSRHEMVLPELDLGDVPLVASVWHVGIGREVTQGESVLEILAGEVVVDLPAPVSGYLAEKLVTEDEPLRVGQPVAVIVARPPVSA